MPCASLAFPFDSAQREGLRKQTLCWLASLQILSSLYLQPMEKHADGERGSGPSVASSGLPVRFFQTESLLEISQAGCCFCLWQSLEATLLRQAWQPVLCAAGAMGYCSPCVVEVPPRLGCRLVGH